jgi:hypothetical protein
MAGKLKPLDAEREKSSRRCQAQHDHWQAKISSFFEMRFWLAY